MGLKLNKKGKAIVSSFLTISVIAVLLFSGFASAVEINFATDKTSYLPQEKITFNVNINIDPDERIPIQDLKLKIYDDSIPFLKECIFQPTGAKISGCEFLTITPVTGLDYGTSDELKGFGYGFDMDDNYLAKETLFGYGYGYGYGEGYGYSGMLGYLVVWDIAAEGVTHGNFKATLEINSVGELDSFRYTKDSNDFKLGECNDGEIRNCGATDVGECSYGKETCVNGMWGSCVGYVGPATEICDNKDNDCDTQVDEGVSTRYYYDYDGDSYGTSSYQDACAPSTFFKVLVSGDCDDTNSNINPTKSEIENGVDDNCNGVVDEGLGPIACSNDAQCGTSYMVKDDYCSGNDVYKDYKNYKCVNPGKTISYCTSSTSPAYQKTCNEGTLCYAGSCRTVACSKNSDCGSSYTVGSKYCGSDDNVYQNYVNPICYNAETAIAFCDSNPPTSAVMLTDCVDGCSNAQCIENTAPVITSTAVTNVAEGTSYEYKVTATDNEQQTKLWFSDDSTMFNIDPLSGLIKFTPTKANVGKHIIIISVSDGYIITTQQFTLNIESVNSAPVLDSIGSLSATEGKEFTKLITATDKDNDVLTFSDNTDLFEIDANSGVIVFTPTKEQVGNYEITITVSDDKLTDSEIVSLNVLGKDVVNTAPQITSYSPLENPTISELESKIFSIIKEDKESVPGVQWYLDGAVLKGENKDSYTFVGVNSMRGSNAGIYTVKAVVSDGILSVEKSWTLTVTRVKDVDADGVKDEIDNCVFVANVNQSDSDADGIGDACEGNIDGDSVADEKDFVAGTVTNVDTNIDLGLKIGNSTNLNKEIIGVQTVQFVETKVENNVMVEKPVVTFDFNFQTETKLDLSKVEIKKQSETAVAAEVVIKGIDLTAQGKTKTVYMDKIAGTNIVCIKDAEIASIKEISTSCNGADEYLLSCQTGAEVSGYKCVIENNKYKITGLKHSGAREAVPNKVPQITSYTPVNPINNLNELGSSLTFTVTATDADKEDTLNYKWYLHDSYGPGKQLVSTSSSYSYTAAYGDAGVRGVSVDVSDGKDTVNHKWANIVKAVADNIAIGKATTASSGDSYKVNDNDRGSSWRKWFDNGETEQVISAANPQWVEIDLGKKYKVDRVDIYSNRYYCDVNKWCGQDYKIEYSNDKQTWTSIVSDTDAGNTPEVYLFNNVEARYWRLIITKGLLDKKFLVSEIMIYGESVCKGYIHDGYCWYASGYGQSCVDVCVIHGGVNANPTWNDDTNCTVSSTLLNGCPSGCNGDYADGRVPQKQDDGWCFYRKDAAHGGVNVMPGIPPKENSRRVCACAN